MDDDRGALLDLLVRRVVAREDAIFRVYRPALGALVAGRPVPTLLELAEALDEAADPELIQLRRLVEQNLLGLARRAHALREQGREWAEPMQEELAGLDQGSRPRAREVLDRLQAAVLRLAGGEEEEFQRRLGELELHDVPWQFLPWREVCLEFGLAGVRLPEEPDASPAEVLAAGRSARRRLAVRDALHFGARGNSPREVLARHQPEAAELERHGQALAERYPRQLARLIAELAPDATDEMRRRLRPEPESPAGLEAQEEPQPPPSAPDPVSTPTPPPETASSIAPPRPPEPPRRPSIWKQHLQPFLLDNWYVAIGALMVVIGSSLVAYFTWERHWAVRYTVLPALLGGFTATLAWVGSRLERADPTLTGTGAVLRGAAIALLPINFMTVALFAGDPEIEGTRYVVPLVAALYLGVFGLGLRRWCSEVHPALGRLLGGTLTALCALVLLRPLAITVAVSDSSTKAILGTGFYLGFAAVGAAVFGFTSRVLDEELAREKRVPWFFGATLGITFLQVFAWVHASLGQLPHVYTYAPLILLAGALLLHTERKVLTLSGHGERIGAESFLGYAAVLLGLLMAQPEPRVRILGFALAGLVWLRQATPRRHPLHAWIGLTLLALAGASVSLLPSFPGEWRGWLGLGVGVGFGAASAWFTRRGEDVLAEAARHLQVVLVVIASAVAMLAQWHYASPPLWTAVQLLATAALLLVLAHREGRERWVLTAAVQLALALPYLGCVDLEGRSWQGNAMVFGLGVLSLGWIALDFLRPTKLTRASRSTVLWFYGALAVAGMALRVLIERDALHPLLDHTGPLLSAIALAFATYWSRSLVPAAMAAGILVILFPELRSHYRDAFEQLGWGSGLGSAVSAATLVGVCAVLRRLPALRELGPGDRFLGREPFPLRRHDWTLFTWPIVASVIFLLAKTGTVVLYRNFEFGITPRAALAQVLCGAAWIGVAAYGHRRRAARYAVWAGFFQLFVGLFLWPSDSFDWARPLLIGGLLVQAFALVILRFGADWARELLAAPALALLRRGALVVAPICIAGLLERRVPASTHLLVAFTGAVLFVNGVWSRRRVFGAALFPLVFVEALFWTRGVEGSLFGSTPWHLVVTGASLALGVQLLDAALGRRPAEFLRPVLRPSQGWAVALALLSAGYACFAIGFDAPYELGGLAVTAAAALAVARTHRSGLFSVLGSLVVYGLCCAPPDRVLDLAMPWRLGLFAASLAAAGTIGKRLPERWLAGRDPLRFESVPPARWVAATAALLGIAAAGLHLLVPEWRASPAQLGATYLAAAAWFLVGRLVRIRPTGYVVAALFTLANVHLVRVLAGDWLAAHGISEIQTVAMGLMLTLTCALVLRPWVRSTDLVDRSAAFLGTLLLVLLATQYVARPDLSTMTVTRLLVSGALAYGAAFTFRTLARHPHDPVTVHVRFAESAYHLGLTVALWCVALLVPWFRQPSAALVALSAPFFFFVMRANLLRGGDSRTERSYVESATVLGYLLLGLYLLRGIFQVVLFPGTPVLTDHYHHNALLVMAVGLGLLRLHVHGRSFWRAFYAGVALIAGSYFALTSFPGLSVFEDVVPAGWVLIGVVHFWTLASHQRSPLRAGLQELASIDDEEWDSLRRGWGFALLAVAQLPPILAAVAPSGDTYAIAPLLAGSATVFFHHGMLRRLPLYFALAGAELLVALHLDLLVPSYLPWRSVVWILLGGWAGLFVADAWTRRRLPPRRVAWSVSVLAMLVAGHVLLHHPGSAVGWISFAAGVLLLLATPSSRAERTGHAGDAWTPALLLAPAWLGYFGALSGRDFLDAWPMLVALGALLATGAGTAWIRARELPFVDPEEPRLGHRLFDLCRRHGDRIAATILYVAFAGTAAAFVLHYQSPFEPRELFCLCLLFASCAIGFHLDGQARRAMLPYYLLQLAVLALFAAIRRQLMLTTDFWTNEYDVWAACLTTVALAGAKEIWDLRPREVRVPVTSALFTLPLVAMIWTLVHGLGVNVALLVLGVHSLTYAFLGKDDRESPYHLVAVAGFVGFVVLAFWSKLELRIVQAYVIPVGIGILVLTQLFRARLAPGVRDLVRTLAVGSMIGSAAYEALLDARYPIAFHVSLLLLGIAGLSLGGFLRVRLYLAVGCAGILVALASIIYRSLAGLEQAARMSAVGVLVLVLGAGLVAGAIYYKTHRERVNAAADRWRRRLGEWD